MSVKEHDQAPMGAVEANYLAQITHRFNRFVMLCCPVCGEWSLAGVGMGNRQLEDSVARVDIPAATLEAERRLLGHKGFLLLGEYGYLLTCADHGLADVHRMANPHAYTHPAQAPPIAPCTPVPHAVHFQQRHHRGATNEEATTMTATNAQAPDNSILERLRKLFAMTTSPNVNEAAVAAAKAQALLAQYNLEAADVLGADGTSKRRQYDAERVVMPAAGWRVSLLHGIATNNWCDTMHHVGQRAQSVVGERHNVQVVLWLYDYVASQIEDLCARWADLEVLNPSRADRNAFRVGAVRTVVHRLSKQKQVAKATDPSTNALVVAVDDELARTLREMWPHFTMGARSSTSSARGLAAGHAAGQRVSLARPVASGGGGTAALGSGRR